MPDSFQGGCACGAIKYQCSAKPVISFYTSKGDSGGDMSRGFCAVCGSPVVARFSRIPDLVRIPAASLDDPSWHKPAFDMFTSSTQPWDHMNPELPKFSEGPPQKN